MAGAVALPVVWSAVTVEQLSYKLPDFEGPLDLLLHLIAKNKQQITKVRITPLLDQK